MGPADALQEALGTDGCAEECFAGADSVPGVELQSQRKKPAVTGVCAPGVSAGVRGYA